MSKIKTFIGSAICILVLCIAFFSIGFYFGSAKTNAGDVAKYESRIKSLEIINGQLQNENSQSIELNRSVSNRLAEARKIIDGLTAETSTDGDAIQRLVNDVSSVEQFVSSGKTGK